MSTTSVTNELLNYLNIDINEKFIKECKLGNLKNTTLLLKYIDDINIQNTSFQTALYKASVNGHTEIS